MRGKARQGDRHGVRPAEPRRVDLGPRDGRAARGGSRRAAPVSRGPVRLGGRVRRVERTRRRRRDGDRRDGRRRWPRRGCGRCGTFRLGASRLGAPSDPVSDAAVEAAAERRKLRPLWDELRRITRAVSDDHDLDVVSDWIRTNRDALVASVGPAEGESLAREVEFMTAKIRYVKLLVAGDGAGAIAQGRATLGAFAESHAGMFVVCSRRRRTPRAASRGRRTRTSPEPRRRRSARRIRRTRVRIPAPARAGTRPTSGRIGTARRSRSGTPSSPCTGSRDAPLC